MRISVTTLRSCLATPLLLLGMVGLPVDLDAQVFRFANASQTQFGGSMGDIMGVLSVGDEPTVDTTWIGQGMMRTDSEGASSIIDFGEGSMIQIDHDARTWFSFRFGDLQQMQAQMQDQLDEADRQRSEIQEDVEEVDDTGMPEFRGELSVDRTGQRSRINGFDAEQIFLIIHMEAQSEDEPSANPTATLRMVHFTEVWMSEELESHPAFQLMAEEAVAFAREDLEMDVGALSTTLGSDPRMIDAMERYEEEMQGLEGMAVRTTSLFLVLPPGIEFDRTKAIEKLEMAPPRELSFDFDVTEAATDAARESALSAARGALSRFGFGRGGDDEEEQQEDGGDDVNEPTQQMTITRMLSEFLDVEEVNPDPAIFLPPADYEEIPSPLSGMGGIGG